MTRSKLDLLDIITAKVNVNTVLMRIKLTLEEIKQKQPTRLDYIEPMEKSIEQLTDSYLVFTELENDWRQSRQRNLDLELIVLKQTKEIEDLKEIVETQNKMNEL